MLRAQAQQRGHVPSIDCQKVVVAKLTGQDIDLFQMEQRGVFASGKQGDEPQIELDLRQFMRNTSPPHCLLCHLQTIYCALVVATIDCYRTLAQFAKPCQIAGADFFGSTFRLRQLRFGQRQIVHLAQCFALAAQTVGSQVDITDLVSENLALAKQAQRQLPGATVAL